MPFTLSHKLHYPAVLQINKLIIAMTLLICKIYQCYHTQRLLYGADNLKKRQMNLQVDKWKKDARDNDLVVHAFSIYNLIKIVNKILILLSNDLTDGYYTPLSQQIKEKSPTTVKTLAQDLENFEQKT